MPHRRAVICDFNEPIKPACYRHSVVMHDPIENRIQISTLFMNRFATAIAIPFLAVVGLLFACLRLLLGTLMRTVGWHLAWPPVEVGKTSETSRTREESASPVRDAKVLNTSQNDTPATKAME